ncbi:hypothetical protein AQUCO_09400005v1 [Aquilegia coerulea]|uniref:Transmembrane protein n=1 Tax=Aquilegia coerulea TaxID=218851 RepID=A0A2G5C501_AQUCA|nr:hypothetical protein AQUCO_09400005v1 [Aquilegia coerulea]
MGSSSSSSVSFVAIFITFLLLLTDFNQRIPNSVLADMEHYKNIGRAQDMSSYVLTDKLGRIGLLPPPAPSANRRKSTVNPPPPGLIS